ncbi:MAG: cytidine deaminase [Armatimonadota bacterium]|nr:cytidine deaminase [bacterium]
MSIDKNSIVELLTEARDARENAHAPYSGFWVGAAVLCDSGKIYTGCNIENASYGLTVCAERVAVMKAVSNGERRVRAIAIVTDGPDIAQPCGACLQVIAEFCTADEPAIIVSGTVDLQYKVLDLNEYLPMPFRLKFCH